MNAAARVSHDLGKYVVFEVAWCGPDAPALVLREALRNDLLHTRRDPSGSVGAVALWAELRAALGEEAAAPEVAAIDAAMEAVAAGLPALDAEPPEPSALAALAAAAEDVRRSCYAWAERTRRS